MKRLLAALLLVPWLALAQGQTPGQLQTTWNGGNANFPNTTSPLGYQWNGQTLIKAYGNSGNQFGNGPGTDTLVGLGAGANLPTADYLTTAVGWHALNASTMANTESTAIGWNSQGSITDGDMNTTVGINALGTSLHSHHVICIGTDCMRNGTGSASVGVGVDALMNDAAGSNIGIGDVTYESNLSATGQLNVAIGWQTFQGLSLTTGSNNIVIGAASANGCTSCSSNIFIGRQVATAVTVAFQNVLIGDQAGQNMAGNGVNTWIGNQAGHAATSAQQSTILGANVGSTTFGTGSGVLLIGSGKNTVDTPLSGTSDYINIENILTTTGTNTPSTSVSAFAGKLNVVAGYQSNGTAGVTCSGTPTASFASSNGIVTHC